jgi:hypothetical protein
MADLGIYHTSIKGSGIATPTSWVASDSQRHASSKAGKAEQSDLA